MPITTLSADQADTLVPKLADMLVAHPEARDAYYFLKGKKRDELVAILRENTEIDLVTPETRAGKMLGKGLLVTVSFNKLRQVVPFQLGVGDIFAGISGLDQLTKQQ